MPEIGFPISTAPGITDTESGGRLINAIVEKAPDGSRSKVLYRRAPGLTAERFVTTAGHRGALLVGSVLYIISDDKAYSVTKSGSVYTVTQLTGTIGGEGPVFMARNMNATTQVLIVHSSGMSQINTSGGSISNFSDADLPAVNSICWIDSYFIVTSAAGKAYSSGVNDVTFASTDRATAEADPDGLVRGIARDRDLMLMGVSTTEFWGNVGNPTGFPFQRSTVIPYGLFGSYAVAGQEPGWGNTPCWVANDRTVRILNGYVAEKISTPDLDRLIEAIEDPTELEATAFIASGHAYWVLSSSTWTWVFDKTTRSWAERQSYGDSRWRVKFTVNAFDEWLAFDQTEDSVYKISATENREAGNPLVFEVRSTQTHAFPSPITFDKAAFDFLTGVGLAAGVDPIETDPRVLLSWSDDGGRTFGNDLERALGGEGALKTVEAYRLGQCGARGRQWRLRVSDPVTVSLMGGAWDGRVNA